MNSFLTDADPKILFSAGLPWFKLYRTLFQQPEIKHLKLKENGGFYISLFLELVGMAIDHHGQLVYELGEDLYIYDAKKIAHETGWAYDNVRMALLELGRLNLIVKENGTFVIPYATKVTGKTKGAIATAKWRQKLKEQQELAAKNAKEQSRVTSRVISHVNTKKNREIENKEYKDNINNNSIKNFDILNNKSETSENMKTLNAAFAELKISLPTRNAVYGKYPIPKILECLEKLKSTKKQGDNLDELLISMLNEFCEV